MQVLAAQVEETIFEPDLLRVILLAEHRHRQLCGSAKYLDFVDVDFDLTCGQLQIFGAGGALANLAVDAHHPFRPQRLGKLERLAVWVGYDLRQAIMVSQIDEQNAAMIANAMAPARKPHGRADIAVTKRAAGV